MSKFGVLARAALDRKVAARVGCVELRRNRRSGRLVGLYRADEAGLESDPETPWATVCEDHGYLICHASRATARASMADPDWCELCQLVQDTRGWVFTLDDDEDPMTLPQFLRDNQDGLDTFEIDAIRRLQPGEHVPLGGGAVESRLRREV